MVTVPVKAPTVNGVNEMLMLHGAAAGAMGGVLIGHVVVYPKSPALVIEVMTRLAVPLLVNVTVVVGLVVFTVREPNGTVVCDNVIAGAGAATVSVAMLVLVLLPSEVTKFPGLTLTVYAPAILLCACTVMVQLPMAGMVPDIPKLMVVTVEKLINADAPQLSTRLAMTKPMGMFTTPPSGMNAGVGFGLERVSVSVLLVLIKTVAGAKAAVIVGVFVAVSAVVAAATFVPLDVDRAPAAKLTE
jgi:hypothetical protein